MMAIRDTWDDYIQGNQTNSLYSIMATTANPSLSNPVEPYWTHTDENEDTNTTLLTYYHDGTNVVSQYPGNTVKEGFPRPYWWSEEVWEQKVKAAAETEQHSLFRQGWIGVIPSGTAVDDRDSSIDMDIEGETAAMCQECLDGNGLIVFPFNHDLQPDSGSRREDLRLHSVNATTGLHVWDYHMAATQSGDNANSTPSIANEKVFVTYMMYNAETVPANRKAILEVLDIGNGQRLQNPPIYVDEDADAIVLPPTIANGVVYVGTYDYSGDPSGVGFPTKSDDSDDYIRLFALSPVLRLVSTGIYPMEYQDKDTLNNYSSILKERETDYSIGVKQSRRKLQVWVSGGDSKWEEVKDDIQ
jgi:outer membrane protein assembly factor BamB